MNKVTRKQMESINRISLCVLHYEMDQVVHSTDMLQYRLNAARDLLTNQVKVKQRLASIYRCQSETLPPLPDDYYKFKNLILYEYQSSVLEKMHNLSSPDEIKAALVEHDDIVAVLALI